MLAAAAPTGAVGGVGVESERLVAVLEHAVGALELLATLPTPETSVSFTTFLVGAHEGDEHHDQQHERSGGSAATLLARETHDALASHFRLEASLAKQAAERQQRRASVAASTRRGSQRSVSKPPGGDVSAERPEVDEADGFDEDDDDDDADEALGGEGDEEDEEDEDDGWDHDDALRFPRSLHHVVDLLTHDKPARDTLRRLSATRISPDAAAFVHVLTDLIVLRERAVQTSPEQDELQQRALRDAAQRLVELHDDAAQLRFELAAEREARQAHALAHVKSISQLREQLAETQRHATEALRATQRTRDHDAQALRTQFEADKVGVHERALALARVDGRVADAHQAEEGDDRRRVARAVADLNELLARYDDEMAALDDALEVAQDEALDAASDVARLATYFERVDEDRHHQLEEQRAREAEEARRRRRDLNLFKFTTRLQALVRGFLTRRRVRLEEKLQQQRRRKKKTKKGSSKGSPKKTKSKTTKTAAKPGRDETKSSSSSSPRKPSRPASAAASATRTRPASARRGVA